ncbi:MAG: hypothetical protein QME94_17160, partial [Anaerolineae bacterium]|nr:hypothetical protein [Anaerolineae bacterium]
MTYAGVAATRPSGAQLDLDELRQSRTVAISIALMCAGAAVFVWHLPAPRYNPALLAVSLSVFAEGVACYCLRTRAPVLSRALLALGPTLSIALALGRVRSPVVPYLPTLVAIASTTISWGLGATAAVLNTVSLLLLTVGQAQAITSKKCWLCHTMHNSQDND